MSNREEEFYRQKYLKYKAKYLEAKNEVEGGAGFCANIGCGKCKYYIYFCKDIDEETTFKKDIIAKQAADGCEFDNYLATKFDGKFGYIEKRSIKTEQAPFYKIKLCGKTLFGKSVASYDKGPSFKTYGIISKKEFKIKDIPESQQLLEHVKSEGLNFTHYFVKSYKCLTVGNDSVPRQNLYKITDLAPADEPPME
jgi:hypothetical protein